MSYQHTASNTEKLTKVLIDIGAAVSQRQALIMATIASDTSLSETARDSLLLIARRVGADFDPADVTAEQIEKAVTDVLTSQQKIALALLPAEGSA